MKNLGYWYGTGAPLPPTQNKYNGTKMSSYYSITSIINGTKTFFTFFTVCIYTRVTPPRFVRIFLMKFYFIAKEFGTSPMMFFPAFLTANVIIITDHTGTYFAFSLAYCWWKTPENKVYITAQKQLKLPIPNPKKKMYKYHLNSSAYMVTYWQQCQCL